MTRRFVISACLLLLASLYAQSKPSFTGKWKLDPDKSNFGQLPMPESMIRTIEHAEPNLTVETVQKGQQGEITTKLKFTTDGKESTNTIRDAEVKSTATWEGNVLKVESRRKFQDAELKITDRWSLSEDGKTFRIESHIEAPQGSIDISSTFDKQ